MKTLTSKNARTQQQIKHYGDEFGYKIANFNRAKKTDNNGNYKQRKTTGVGSHD